MHASVTKRMIRAVKGFMRKGGRRVENREEKKENEMKKKVKMRK